MILANRLKPKRLDAEGPPADFRVPQEEPGRERLAVDLRPAGGIDQKHEHVLLAAIQASRSSCARLRRLEVSRELANDIQQISIPQPGVGHAVERTDAPAGREQLDRLVSARHGLLQSPAGRFWR